MYKTFKTQRQDRRKKPHFDIAMEKLPTIISCQRSFVLEGFLGPGESIQSEHCGLCSSCINNEFGDKLLIPDAFAEEIKKVELHSFRFHWIHQMCFLNYIVAELVT